jgi:hypothetical protein
LQSRETPRTDPRARRAASGALHTIGPEAAVLAQQSLRALVPVLEALRHAIELTAPAADKALPLNQWQRGPRFLWNK